MKTKLNTAAILAALLLTLGLTGCENNDDLGDRMEESAEGAGEAVEDTAEQVGEKIENTAERAEDKVD